VSSWQSEPNAPAAAQHGMGVENVLLVIFISDCPCCRVVAERNHREMCVYVSRTLAVHIAHNREQNISIPTRIYLSGVKYLGSYIGALRR
jgi:hypothetical protein